MADEFLNNRITALDLSQDTRDRLVRVEAKLDLVATKESVEQLRTELHKSVAEQTLKIIGAAAALVSAVYLIAKNVQ